MTVLVMLKEEKLFMLQSVKHGLSLLMYIEDLYHLFLSFFFLHSSFGGMSYNGYFL